MIGFVSIVIPTYNHSEYLHECLLSVVSQTIENWEAIVVDDCSTDGDVLAITKGFQDQRIKLVRHDHNRGLAASRNTGIRIAKGQFILPLDADDKLATGCLQELTAFLDENPAYDCVFPDFHTFGIHESIVKYQVRDLRALLLQQWIPGSGTLLRRSLWEKVGGYCEAEQLRAGNEDWDFYLGVAETTGFKAGHISEPLYFYRKHKESMVTRLAYFDCQTRVFMYDRHQQIFDDFELGHKFIADGYCNSIVASLKRRELHRAVNLVYQAWLFPSNDIYGAKILIKEIIATSISRIYQKIYKSIRNMFRHLATNVFRQIYKLGVGRKLYWEYKTKDIDNTWGEAKHDYEVLQTIMNSIKPARVLDIGCGTGRLFPLYKSLKVKEIYGQDIATSALRIVKERFPDNNIHLISSGITDLQFPDYFFDIVISNRVLQSIPENLIKKNIEFICKLCKFIYINEISDTKELRSIYCYKHDYVGLFKKFGFFEIKTGYINEQKWSLFEKSNGHA